MNKAYTRINWVNYPSTDTALNATNLNRMDLALDTVDDRVITLDTTKADEADLLTCVASISFNPTTGIMTITLKNGTQGTIDTGLSKLAVNFDYDDDPTSPHYQQIILEMADGTYKYIDLSALITQYEFSNTSTIAFTVGTGGVISASVIDGSITADKLQPNYLADIILQVGYAQSAATSASTDATLAESYAVGGTGTRTGEDTDNAKYYCEQAALIAGQTLGGLTDVTLTSPSDGQVLKYNAETGEWENGEGGLGTAVSYEAQTLTDPQKAQARENIDAASQSVLNVVGAKNLMPNYGYSQTIGGVTFNVNADGSVTISGSNTSGAVVYFPLSPNWQTAQGIDWLKNLIGKNVILSDGIQNSDITTRIATFSNGVIVQALYVGTATIASGFDRWDASISVEIGASFSDAITVKPMIRLASDTDDTYEPYAQTNRQLTVGKVNTDAIAPTEDGATASKAYVVGEPFFRGGDYCVCISAIASGGSFTLNTNYIVTTSYEEIMRKRIVRAREVTYAQGITSYGPEKVMCLEFSDGSILVNGAIYVSSNWTNAPDSKVFTFPSGVKFPYNTSQRWVRLFNMKFLHATQNPKDMDCLCGGGSSVVMWETTAGEGQSRADFIGDVFIVNMSW